ncbi:hypothetical protein JCM5350_007939 [Sporobolomyces pararoseus]
MWVVNLTYNFQALSQPAGQSSKSSEWPSKRRHTSRYALPLSALSTSTLLITLTFNPISPTPTPTTFSHRPSPSSPLSTLRWQLTSLGIEENLL